MQTIDVVLIFLEILLAAFLYWVASFSNKVLNTKWKLCYVIPFFVTEIILVVGDFEMTMLPAYIGALLCLLGFFKEDISLRRISAVILVAGALLCTVTTDNAGYREIDYVRNFEASFNVLKEHYDMAEHKDINWDSLYDTYMPRMKEAKKNHDEVAYGVAFKQFINEFHDGHVSMMQEEDKENAVFDNMAGNDYGFSMVRLADGSFVAVNVADNSAVAKAGMKNGTEIRSYNGQSMEALCDNVDMSLFGNIPLKENEDFYRPMVAAGCGEDTINITFVGDGGTEQSVEVASMGNYSSRLKSTMEIIDQGVNITNMTMQEVNAETYVLRIKEMSYDEESYENGDFSAMQAELRNQLLELKQKNVNHLIIDIRSNGGGSPQMIMAIAAMFAPEGAHVYGYEGVFDKKSASYVKEQNGAYKVGLPLTYVGENVWENRKVTILVNAQSVSAADHFAYMMQALDLDHIELVGFTKTNASAQAISGIPIEGGLLTYSCVPTLDQDGNILIDPDVSRTGGIELDRQIPLTKEAVKVLFDEKQDYVLQYVLEN